MRLDDIAYAIHVDRVSYVVINYVNKMGSGLLVVLRFRVVDVFVNLRRKKKEDHERKDWIPNIDPPATHPSRE